jgi:hypothetical protein
MIQKLSIGYVPYSKDLSHPGDRRRIGILKDSLVHKLEIDSPLDGDLLVLSGAANLNYWIRKTNKPIVLDIVDGYLGERPGFVKDALRNLVRSINGSSNFSAITYSRALKKACSNASAVIVASSEQAEFVRPLNKSVFVVLDDHSELDQARSLKNKNSMKVNQGKYIFWEGFGYTLRHFKILHSELDNFMYQNKYKMVILTNTSFARWGGYIGKVETSKLFKKWFPLSYANIEIVPWTIENVIHKASQCDFAIIPVDTRDKFANLKPENKLLSMWHLGLPTLFSDTRAYKRIANSIGISSMCIEQEGWKTAFRNLDLTRVRESTPKMIHYIETTHTKDILVEKWQQVIEAVLAKDA